MTAIDLMGAPYIHIYSGFAISGTTIAIDNFLYYTTGSIVTISSNGLNFGNIYNVVNLIPNLNSGNLNTFNYAAYTTNNNDNLTNLHDASISGSPTFALTPPLVAGGDFYVNSSPVLLNVNARTIGLTLTNLLSKTSGSTYAKLFPTGQTWGGNSWGLSQSSIGYLPSAPGTGEIQIAIGASIRTSISAGATRASVTGVTNYNGVNLPSLSGPQQWTNITLAPSYIPSTYDAVYNPFGNVATAPLSGTLNATNFFTSLAASYIVPESGQPNPSTVFPTGGSKFLLLTMSNSGPLITFPINFGTTSTGLGIVNVSIFWIVPGLDVSTQKWWSVVKNNVNVDHGTVGAGGGWDWKTATVAMNDTMHDLYVAYYATHSPSNSSIFLCIEFTGTLNISDIVVG
jgi:hypothetical protein